MARPWGTGMDRRGVVAVEFALLAPVLIVLAMSLTDVTHALITLWRLSSAANAIARIATNLATTNNNIVSLNNLTTTQATTASTALFGVVPELISAPLSKYGVTISSIVITATVNGCTSNCTYVARTAWSTKLQGSSPIRPCGTLASVPNGQPAAIGTLPVDAFTAAPLLVVDVTYNFVPVFTNLFGSGRHFMETAYMGTRIGGNADWTRLTGPNFALAQCPGYTG